MRSLQDSIIRHCRFATTIAVVVVVAVSTKVAAETVPPSLLIPAVETWVRQVTADPRPEATVDHVSAITSEGDTVAYIAHLADSGFCICGAEDFLLPVYLYSPRGRYDAQNPPLNVLLSHVISVAQCVKQRIAFSEPEYVQLQTERQLYWQSLAGREPIARDQSAIPLSVPTELILDFRASWDQHSPYNDNCPDLNGVLTVAGCTAIAMAQVMNYWSWPPAGEGPTVSVDYTYRYSFDWHEMPYSQQPVLRDCPGFCRDLTGMLEWEATPEPRLRMKGYWDSSLLSYALSLPNGNDFDSVVTWLYWTLNEVTEVHDARFGTYDWDLILDDHSVGSSPEQDAEVAQLVVDAGIAAGMDYGVVESGSPLGGIPATRDALDALEDHFRFDDCAGEEGGGPLQGIEPDMIVEDLSFLRPVPFGGRCGVFGSAHNWVIYGYRYLDLPQADWEFIMNFGWDNALNGTWYTLDNIVSSPNLCHYDTWLQHLTYLAPRSFVKFAGSDSEGDGRANNPYQGVREAFIEAPQDNKLIFRSGWSEDIGSPVTRKESLIIVGRNVTIK